MGSVLPWIYFSYLARKEYVATVRGRFESRRLDLASRAHHGQRRRHASAAGRDCARRQSAAGRLCAGIAGEAPRYDMQAAAVASSAASPAREVREKVYRNRGAPALGRPARPGAAGDPAATIRLHSAVQYALSVAPDRAALAAELLDDRRPVLVQGALEALRSDRDLARGADHPRLARARHPVPKSPHRRALAATRHRGPRRPGYRGASPAASGSRSAKWRGAACRAAGVLKNRAYLFELVNALAQSPAARRRHRRARRLRPADLRDALRRDAGRIAAARASAARFRAC